MAATSSQSGGRRGSRPQRGDTSWELGVYSAIDGKKGKHWRLRGRCSGVLGVKDDEAKRPELQERVDVEHRKRSWQRPKTIYHKDIGVEFCSEGSRAPWTFRAFRV